MTTKIKGIEGVEFPDASAQGSAAYNKTQADAVFAKLAQFTGALQPYGHFRLPGNLLVCWGTVTPDANGNTGVTWNRSFAEIPYAVVCRAQVNDGSALPAAGDQWLAMANSITASGCQMSARYNSAGTGIVPSVWPIQYLAVGRDS